MSLVGISIRIISPVSFKYTLISFEVQTSMIALLSSLPLTLLIPFFKGVLLVTTPQDIKTHVTVMSRFQHAETGGKDISLEGKTSSHIKQMLLPEI